MSQHRERLQAVKQEHLGATHIFDMGHLLDVNHHTYIGSDVGLRLVREAHDLQRRLGLFLPHPRTSFINRVEKPGVAWSIYVAYAQQDNDFILTYQFLYNSRPKRWSWLGMSMIDRHTPHAPPAPATERPELRATVILDTALVPGQRHEDVAVGTLLESAMLLLQKGDTVIVEPAPWWPAGEPAKPKAYETRNPSVSVVHVNTPRLIVRPPRDDDGSGEKRRPHFVRAYLSRHGDKIRMTRSFVRPRGSNPSIVSKVIKIDLPPLEGEKNHAIKQDG